MIGRDNHSFVRFGLLAGAVLLASLTGGEGGEVLFRAPTR